MKNEDHQRFNEDAALKLLKKYAPDERRLEIVLNHSRAVQKMALKLVEGFSAERCRQNGLDKKNTDKELIRVASLDKEFIKVASLLHDIGRFRFPPKTGIESIKHGIEGAKILKEEGWPAKFQLVCERHIGVGIRRKDIIEQKLPLPEQDYVPLTNEEKIITYADNLVEGKECRIVKEEEIVERYRKELGEEHAKRVEKFHKEIHEILSNAKHNTIKPQ
jgi:uncharacterized protein